MLDRESPPQPTIAERILGDTRKLELPEWLIDRFYLSHMEAYRNAFPTIDFSCISRPRLKSVALSYHYGHEAVSAWQEIRKDNPIDLWDETLTEIITQYTQRVDDLRTGKITPAQMTAQLMKAAWLYGTVKNSDIKRIPENAEDIDTWLFLILLGNGNDMSVEDVERTMSFIAKAYFTGDYDELKTTYEERRSGKGLRGSSTHIESLMAQRLQVASSLKRLKNGGMCIFTEDGYTLHISVQKTLEKIIARSASPIFELIFRYLYQEGKMGMSDGQWDVLQAAMEMKRTSRHEFAHFIAKEMRRQHASSI